MNLNMSSVVMFFAKDIIYRSKTPGTWLNGRFTPGPTIDTQIKATVQPATARDLEILPEAERRKQIMTVWSLIEFRISGDETDTDSDLLIIDGNNYKIIHAYDRSQNGFYKSLAEFLP